MSPLRAILRPPAILLVMIAATIGASLILATRWLRPRRPRRSLWAGTPIPTIAMKAAAERRLGIDARTLVHETTHVGRSFDHDLSAARQRPIVGPLVPLIAFLWALWTFDRFHFFCDRGLLPNAVPRRFNAWELRLYRALGREVFFWAYGADVRTRGRTEAWGAPNCCEHCPDPGHYCICDDEEGARNQRAIARFATATFAMGDMIPYVPGCIDDLHYWPIDLEAENGTRYAPSYPDATANRPMQIVHAPNHRYFKGTDHLLRAVERLAEEGHAVELTIVEGMPNHEALAIYRNADVVFDQCQIGFHGYFALEAMALGKPVMCWIREPAYLIDADACPIINTPPEAVEPALRRCLVDRAMLADLGRRGRAYIERYHTPERFAERLERAYRAIGAKTE